MLRVGFAGRWLGGALCCVVLLAGGVTFAEGSALAEPSASSGSLASSAVSVPALDALTVPSLQLLDGDQQVTDQERSLRADPQAVQARAASRTAFHDIGAGRAMRIAREAFPGVVSTVSGGLDLPSTGRVLSYSTMDAAQVELKDGRHAVVESSAPLATVDSSGHLAALDLKLDRGADSFEPVRAAAHVRIPERLEQGVELTDSGISLTPIDEQGSIENGSGTMDGATVLYANVETDTDAVVKPAPNGFAADAVLRSVDSPQNLDFRLAGPASARLIQERTGEVRITVGGETVARVLAPSASDAAGTAVPVSMKVAGRLLELSVEHRSGDYRYPIEVDPTVVDTMLTTELEYDLQSNWREGTFNGNPYGPFYPHQEGNLLEDSDNSGVYERGQWGAFAYETQGESRISAFYAETSATNAGSNIENNLWILGKGGAQEAHWALPANYGLTGNEICAGGNCAEGGTSGNAAEFQQVATTTGSSFSSQMHVANVQIEQANGPSVWFDTKDPVVDGQPNLFYTGGWMGPVNGEYPVQASDPGLGISKMVYRFPAVPGWTLTQSFLYPAISYRCKGVQCERELTETVGDWRPNGTWLPDGEDVLEAQAFNATGASATATTKIKVDSTPPHGLSLTGLPANHEIGNGQYHLKASATDGSGTTPSSGVASIAISLDGKAFGSPAGGCTPGPCSSKGEWAISGTELAAGQHSLLLKVVDGAGNWAEEEIPLYVARPTTPIPVGPGAADPQSGELRLEGTDVSVDSPGSSLTVTRSYGSLHLTAGSEGPLGPDWNMNLGNGQSVTKLPDGSALLSAGTGVQSVFAPKGGGEFTSPQGDEDLKLSEVTVEGQVQFKLLAGSGAVTNYRLPSGGTGSTWVAATQEGPGHTEVTTYSYQVSGGILEPTRVLAPVAAGVSCSPELTRGCRALGFVYASKTTASGDAQSEWGDYEGRLSEITFTAWDPASSKMTTTALAHYQYDKEGRLRAEWDPRISPALKTTYGYDAAGHVTAETLPGQQPWIFSYGTIPGDNRSGRLLSVTRPSAATAAGSGTAPQNTAAPTLSGPGPQEGTSVSALNGTWSNGPLAYSYQWIECETPYERPEKCSPILGATNRSYIPVLHRTPYTLSALVTATNASGSVTVSTAKSSVEPVGYLEKRLEFGSKGSGNGQLNSPSGIAIDSSENLWVADTANNRIEKFSVTGTFLAAYGKEGTGSTQFKEPRAITISHAGYVYVSDSGNKRVEIFNLSGTYQGSIATPAAPSAVAVAPSGQAMFVAEASTNDIGEYYLTGPYTATRIGAFGAAGSGNGQFNNPFALQINEAGNRLYVVDRGNHRVQVLEVSSYTLKYLSQFGSAGGGPGQFATPAGIGFEPPSLTGTYAIPLDGAMFVVDPGGSRIQQLSSTGAYRALYNESGAEAIVFDGLKMNGSMFVANSTTDKIVEWEPGARINPLPTPPTVGENSVWTLEYHVPVTGANAPYSMGAGEVATWAQKDAPAEATALFPPDEPEGWPAQDYKRASVYYLDTDGRTVNVAQPGGGIATTEYNEDNDAVRNLSADNRQRALAEGAKSAEVAQTLDTQSTYSSNGAELLSTLGPQHNVKLAKGTQALARYHAQYSYDEGAPKEGGPYGLVTKLITGAQLAGGVEEDVRTTTTSYSGQEGLGWKLRQPTSVTTDPGGVNLVHSKLYDPSTGNLTDTIDPAGNQKGGDTHDTQTVYYSAAANSKAPACGGHPEWANLACQSEPAAQPGTSGLPELPVSTDTYNLWDEPETVTEVVGASTRTTSQTYDGAGRLQSSSTSSSVGTALPTVKDAYEPATGLIAALSTTQAGTTQTLSSVHNSLGQLTSYTDADESTSSYTYDVDGRVSSTSDGKGSQSFSYDPTSGELASLTDSAAGTFTAAYDPEGHMLSEGYPNGMTAAYSYDSTGRPIGLTYTKVSDCSSNCVWYSDSVVPSIAGQALSQTSTFSSQQYQYDGAGRLTQVQDTPVGQGCTTRVYAYDADTNRTSLITRSPGTGGVCATTGGITESHTYDSADRLTESGIKYDAFGNITTLPAADAGGTTLSSTFYVDNTLATQFQNGQDIGYKLDPEGRTREIVDTGKVVSTSILHYSGPSGSPSWISELSGKWTRDIPGPGGSLAAVQSNGEAPVLEISDLHGDTVATASLSETATALSSSNDTTEYGVPRTGTPPRYSWLGSDERATELPSGVVAMGARSYVPQLGRFLQTDPVPGGSANAYSYGFGDPVNSSDPSGESSFGFSGWLQEANNQIGQEVIAREAAREAAARAEAEARARAAAEVTASPEEAVEAIEEAGGMSIAWPPPPGVRIASAAAAFKGAFSVIGGVCTVMIAPFLCQKHHLTYGRSWVLKLIKWGARHLDDFLEIVDKTHECLEGAHDFIEQVEPSLDAMDAEMRSLAQPAAWLIGCYVGLHT